MDKSIPVVSSKLNTVAAQWLLKAITARLLARLVIVVFGALLLTLSGPFGTFQAGSFTDRFVYWVVVMAASVALRCLIKTLLDRLLLGWSCIAKDVISVFVLTLLLTPFFSFWTLLRFTEFADVTDPVLWLGKIVFISSVVICSLKHAVPFVFEKADMWPKTPAPPPRILRRLPIDFRGKIIHLEVDGHMVQVITDTGTFELRMRFVDAVEEVSELDGCCAHRSHWIVLSEIENVKIVNGRPCLLMTSGREVPVSRKFQPDLEALGVL